MLIVAHKKEPVHELQFNFIGSPKYVFAKQPMENVTENIENGKSFLSGIHFIH